MLSQRTSQCAKCGHLCNDANPFFSEDFAAYFCRSPMVALSWCYHCGFVSLYKRPALAALLRSRALKLSGTVSLEALREHPLGQVKDTEIGGSAALHLLRMIWSCLQARIELENGSKDPEAAMHLAIEKLEPSDAALMAVMTANAGLLVPLEQQIMEGNYLGQDGFEAKLKTRSWIGSSPLAEKAKATLQIFDAHQETPQ